MNRASGLLNVLHPFGVALVDTLVSADLRGNLFIAAHASQAPILLIPNQ